MTKFSQWYKETALPAGLLSSLIIGAGIFALPYVFQEAGFLLGLFYLAIFTAVFTAVHKMYAGVIENTEGKHRFVGYARIYYKKFGFIATIFTTAIGFTLTLVAYIALAKNFLVLIVPGVQAIYAPYIFWGIGSLAVILSLKRLENLEFAITISIGFIVFALFAVGVFYGRLPKITAFNFSQGFLPYGVVLFALSGRAAISSIVDYYERRKFSKDKLMKSISLGTIAPAAIYVLFVLGVLLLSHGTVSQDSLSGLIGAPHSILILVGLLGVLALLTSYFFLSIEVGEIFRYDFKMGRLLSTLSVIVLPILLYAMGLKNFIWLVGLVGGVFLAMDSIIAVAMYSKIKGWRPMSVFLVLVLAAGAAFEIFSLI